LEKKEEKLDEALENSIKVINTPKVEQPVQEIPYEEVPPKNLANLPKDTQTPDQGVDNTPSVVKFTTNEAPETTIKTAQCWNGDMAPDGDSANCPPKPSPVPEPTPPESVSSFLAGTKISTSKGEVSIESLSVGDNVLSFDPNSLKTSEDRVEKIYTKIADEYYFLKFDNGSELKVTAHHPIFTNKKLFIEVKNLKLGDEVWTTNISTKIISIQKINQQNKVFNLKVSNNQTYFANGIGVHNKNPDSVKKEPGSCIGGCVVTGGICISSGSEFGGSCCQGGNLVDGKCNKVIDIERLGQGGVCHSDEGCSYGLKCYSGTCKQPSFMLVYNTGEGRTDNCIPVEAGPFTSWQDCEQAKRDDSQIKNIKNITKYRYDSSSKNCVEDINGSFISEKDCKDTLMDERSWSFNTISSKCERNQISGRFGQRSENDCVTAQKSTLVPLKQLPISVSLPVTTSDNYKSGVASAIRLLKTNVDKGYLSYSDIPIVSEDLLPEQYLYKTKDTNSLPNKIDLNVYVVGYLEKKSLPEKGKGSFLRRLDLDLEDPPPPSKDPMQEALALANDIYKATHGNVNVNIVGVSQIPKLPPQVPGVVYGGTGIEGEKVRSFDFTKTLNIKNEPNGSNLLQKYNNGEIGQIWIWGGPETGADEYGSNVDPNLPTTYVFNYNVGKDNSLHTISHSIEDKLRNSDYANEYKIWSGREIDYKTVNYEDSNITYDKALEAVKNKSLNAVGYGNVHFTPNSLNNYDYNNSAVTVDIPGFSPHNCELWNCNQNDYLIWWQQQMPTKWYGPIYTKDKPNEATVSLLNVCVSQGLGIRSTSLSPTGYVECGRDGTNAPTAIVIDKPSNP
jgi:hypothetical protein